MALTVVHTTPKEFENRALFLRLGLIRHVKRALSGQNAVQTWGIGKLRFFVLERTENILKKNFSKMMASPSFLQTQIQNKRWLLPLKVLRRSVDGALAETHFFVYESNLVLALLHIKKGKVYHRG